MSSRGDLQPRPGDALVLIDVQNDFLPGGALPVPHGDEVIETLSAAAAAFDERRLPVVASRDWHPADHCSFRSRGGPWPPHCVAGSSGAAFAPGLHLPSTATIVSKATTADRDEYSDFAGTGLNERLRAAGVSRLFVGGLATDYCVLHTVIDARRAGYDVVLLLDGIRALDVHPGDGDRAIAETKQAGAVAIEWAQAA